MGGASPELAHCWYGWRRSVEGRGRGREEVDGSQADRTKVEVGARPRGPGIERLGSENGADIHHRNLVLQNCGLCAQSCVTLCDPMARLFCPWDLQARLERAVCYFSPEDLPNSGIELVSLASPGLAGRLFTTAPPGKP